MTIDFVIMTLVGKTIVLDPGHGEVEKGIKDPGAVNTKLGVHEADEVRTQANLIKAALEVKGAKVKVIENNTTMSLSDIGKQGAGADAFISLHLNAFNKTAQRHEVLIETEGTSVDETLAKSISNALTKEMPIISGGVKRQGLGVLKAVPLPVPAVLVESYFLDSTKNLDEIRTLTIKSANAISKGIESFFA
jgi:N-acetylmuramoyl-L-alanine amidase